MLSTHGFFSGMKNRRWLRKPHSIGGQKARDGEGPKKPWMNEGEFENLGSQSADSNAMVHRAGGPTPPFGPGGCVYDKSQVHSNTQPTK